MQLQLPLLPFTNQWTDSPPHLLGIQANSFAALREKIDFSANSSEELQEVAEESFEILLPFFLNQDEGSIVSNVKIELSKKMEQKLGLSYLFERMIRLNLKHFINNTKYLPYTLFHEMTHLWLYDCDLDPNHTWRFYRKMDEFSVSGLPVDPSVHVHRRVVSEAECVYSCPNCANRWYLRAELRYPIYCGPCHDAEGVEHYASLRKKNVCSADYRQPNTRR